VPFVGVDVYKMAAYAGPEMVLIFMICSLYFTLSLFEFQHYNNQSTVILYQPPRFSVYDLTT
jgi:hypothetical protein